MHYSSEPEIDRVYRLLAAMLAPADPDSAEPEHAMIIADALLQRGEDRSWASIWWAYGALHHDLSDEALERALGLVRRVEHPPECKAAALMLEAEIKMSQAAYARANLDAAEQRALLVRATQLCPGWPALQSRLAYACKATHDEPTARAHAARALALLAEHEPTTDPFDTAISGRNLDRASVEEELVALGLVAHT